SEQGKLFLQNVSNNDQKIGDINMQLAVLNQVEKSIRSKNEGIIPSTLGVTDPVLSQLINKLYTTELEYESMKKTVGENNPATLTMASQIEKIRPGILDNVESQRRGLEASSRNLAMTNSSYASVLQSIPEKERQLIEINREQSVKNELYAFLLQKREETALSQASRVSDTRIIDVAGSSPDPVSPKRKVVFLAAILAALFTGAALIILKENLNRKIMFRHEIEYLTAQPIIGEIVKERSQNQIVIGDNTRTFIAEQFRRLRASLPFIGISPSRKRILVTSAIGGEGKSFVASNLALSLALTNKRVILIDCDLNNPSLHLKLKIENKTGVSEFLSGKNDLSEIIRPTNQHPDMFFIPTGKLPNNPSELLMNGRMEQLLDALEMQFDYIIVDTAPVCPVTDAYILSPLCNATLFVIRHKYTPKIYIQRIDEDNKINNLKNIALVFNGVSPRGFGSENYGYGYGYGYHQESRYTMRISNA
ncbi:MAG: polysaccharide biosynthesis tyrosine autokinase, partial [Chitinophagaceae bacterium]|nr:polysaccharide biosynthesis tyrosine autokinase [Chitinophagaceae bacterium]